MVSKKNIDKTYVEEDKIKSPKARCRSRNIIISPIKTYSYITSQINNISLTIMY